MIANQYTFSGTQEQKKVILHYYSLREHISLIFIFALVQI